MAKDHGVTLIIKSEFGNTVISKYVHQIHTRKKVF